MAEFQNGVTIDAITALIAASKRMQFSILNIGECRRQRRKRDRRVSSNRRSTGEWNVDHIQAEISA